MTPPRHIGRDLETDGDDADMFRVHVTSPSQKEAMLRIHSQVCMYVYIYIYIYIYIYSCTRMYTYMYSL
jgi:hypothetical protein